MLLFYYDIHMEYRESMVDNEDACNTRMSFGISLSLY